MKANIHIIVEAIFLVALATSLLHLMRVNDNLQKVEDNFKKVEERCSALQTELKGMKSSYYSLENEYNVKMNKTVRIYKKVWAILAENLTLRHRDTLTINLYIASGEEHWGVDGVDRIEVRLVNVYSPDLHRRSVGTGIIRQYLDGRRFGEWRIAYPSHPIHYEVPMPISPNETKVREYPSSPSFFYENWNYIGVDRWMKIELYYISDKIDGRRPTLHISELELYIVGFEDTEVSKVEHIDTAWISYRVEYYIEPYEEP